MEIARPLLSGGVAIVQGTLTDFVLVSFHSIWSGVLGTMSACFEFLAMSVAEHFSQ